MIQEKRKLGVNFINTLRATCLFKTVMQSSFQVCVCIFFCIETFSKCLSEHSLTRKWSCWNITYIKPIFNKQQTFFVQLFPIYSWALQLFWQKNICTKGACKMWVILTKGHTETRSYRNKVLPEQGLTGTRSYLFVCRQRNCYVCGDRN